MELSKRYKKMNKTHKVYPTAVNHESTQTLKTELKKTGAVIAEKNPKSSENKKITEFSIQRS